MGVTVSRIGIVGPQCAGKTTLAEMLGYPVIKFADPLYAINNALHIGKHRAFMQEMSEVVKKHFGRRKFIESCVTFCYLQV